MSSEAATNTQAVIGRLAEEAGGLGREIVDVAGHVDEITVRIKQQAEQLSELRMAAGDMADSNLRISGAAEGAERVAAGARTDLNASRAKVDAAINDIRAL